MSRILLINPPWYAMQNIYFNKVPFGLASIAAVLRKNGHNCLIFDGEFGLIKQSASQDETITIDFNAYLANIEGDSQLWKTTWNNISRLIRDFQPTIIGITIPTAKYSIAVKIADHIKKEFPQIITVAGGPHPTILPLEMIKEPSLDIVVKKEGEYTFLELVDALEKKMPLQNILGIVYKKDGTVHENPDRAYIEDLDALPFPAWDLTYQWEKHPADSFGTIFTSRGCPFQCIYCASNKIWSRSVRFMSADRVVEEIKHTANTFKVDEFRFNDDNFILKKDRAVQICEKIIQAKLNIRWMCEIRANLCTPDLLKLMKKAGCYQVNVGVESGNPESLKYIKKGITVDQIISAFATIRKHKIKSTAYFMIGFPHETHDQINDTIRLMKKIKCDSPCWSIVTPYPGTELYDEVVQAGLLAPKQKWSYFFHHSSKMHISKKLSHEELMNINDKIQHQIDVDRQKKRLYLLLTNPPEFFRRVYRKFFSRDV